MVSVSVPSMSNMTKCMACNLTRKRMEPTGSGATWTGSPKGVFSGRKHHKPPQGELCFRFILHNFSFVLAARRPAVGFIVWLGFLGLREIRAYGLLAGRVHCFVQMAD